MSQLDQSWDRWIRLSVAMALDALMQAQTPKVTFVMNPDRLTNMVPEAVELSIDGPEYEGLVQDVWKAYFTVKVVVEVVDGIDPSRINQITGLIAKTMAVPFKIYKVGSQAGDDRTTLVACTNQENPIKTRPYGMVGTNIKLLQSTVTAKYSVILP